MILLPNNCRCSALAVYPDTWRMSNASVKKAWRITYRFYDDNTGRVKHVFIRGMNIYKTAKDRRDAVNKLLKEEMDRLQNEGFNPITGAAIPPQDDTKEIDPSTHFGKAVDLAIDKLNCADATRKAIKRALKLVMNAARAMQLDKIPVGEVKRKHVKQALERVEEDRELSPGTYNHYRAYMMMVFTELEELEAVEMNPVRGIKKREEVKKIRETLSEAERKTVDKYLHEKYYSFWRYLHIFFHSGSRSSELLRLQGKDINLSEQWMKITVIKGKQKREVRKVIKDIALPLWQELMNECQPDQFVFAKFLKPGDVPIKPYQITNRWNRDVKDNAKFIKENDGKAITASFYALKHLASDSTAALLSLEHAKKHNSHTSEKTTRLYAVNQAEREGEELKSLKNKFA